MQTTIQFETVAQRPLDVQAPIRKAVRVLNQWLDSPSTFYSRLLGETISWRKALRIGVVLPALLAVVAICGIQAPVVTAVSLASAAWLTFRLQKGGAL